jgi:hypothetical protein
VFGAPRQVGVGIRFLQDLRKRKKWEFAVEKGGLRDIESCSLAGAEEQLLLSRE